MERLTDEQFARFGRLIYKLSGIRLDDRKVTLLSSRLQRRLRALNMPDAEAYFRFATSAAGKAELNEMLDVVTTNETSFFRTEPHFDWFTNVFLEEMHAQHRLNERKPSLRIWSAACSIGAEPYSLAFCIAEKRFRLVDWKTSILATDLSETSLQTAREAKYKQRMVDGVPPDKLSRYFRRSDDVPPEYQLRPEYRDMVTFRRHNLMDAIAERPFDCVFLRNVLIYFDDQSKQTVLTHIANAIAPGGYLVIGPSEGIYGLDNPLTKLSTFLYRKSG